MLMVTDMEKQMSLHPPSSAADDDDVSDTENRKSTGGSSELEALHKIYDEICRIRRRHTDLVAENDVKRNEIQSEMDAEKRQLEALEDEHRESGRSMKNLSPGSDELKTAMMKYRSEQDQMETLRRRIDDLEFQLFEMDTYYEEQKELIQQQLMMEQQALSDVSSVYASHSSKLSESSRQTDVVQTAESAESPCDNNYKAPGSHESTAPPSPPRVTTTVMEVLSVRDDDDDEAVPLRDGSELIQTATVASTTDADEVPGDIGECSAVTGSWWLNVSGTDDCSSSTCSDRPSTAAASDAVMTSSDDHDNRKSTNEKRLQFELLPDVGTSSWSDGDAIVMRDRARQSHVQSRPLTRYLPASGQHIDLLAFVEQSGHFVANCISDVIVTSDSACGFLVKMGHRIRTWRRRWFVFDRVQRHLAYFTDQTQLRRPRGRIPFTKIQDVFVFDRVGRVKCPSPDLTFCIKTSKRTFYVMAPNTEVRQLWMEIIFTGAEGYREYEWAEYE